MCCLKRSLTPTAARDFSLVQSAQNSSGPIQPPIQSDLMFFPLEVQWLGYKSDLSSPSCAEAKNTWNYTYTSICFHGMYKDNFTFTFHKTNLQHFTTHGTILNIVRNDKCTSLTVDTYLTVIWWSWKHTDYWGLLELWIENNKCNNQHRRKIMNQPFT